MKHEVWPSPAVTPAVMASYVPLAVDADNDGGLSDRYNVPAIPAVIVLDGNGRIVRRHDGFLPLDGMLQFLSPARLALKLPRILSPGSDLPTVRLEGRCKMAPRVWAWSWLQAPP